MTRTLKIAIAGAAGRMGRQLIRCGYQAGHRILGGSEAPDSAHLNQDLGTLADLPEIGIQTTADLSQAARLAEVWIDFTTPQATLSALEQLPLLGVHTAIIGTTGFTADQERALERAAEKLTVLRAGNFSLGINLLESLVKQAAERLGSDWDIEILETHHRHKQDAPSGTALMLAEAAAAGRGEALETVRADPYLGPNAPRHPGQIGFAVRRSGGVIGEHDVSFASERESISLSHTALDRSVFAHGAIKAAEWAAGQGPGLYSLADMLGLE